MPDLLVLPDGATLLILAPIVLLATFVFQTLGFGAGLIAVPLASLFLDLRFVLPTLALLEFVNALRLLKVSGRDIAYAEGGPLVALSLVGTMLGVTFLVSLPAGWLMIGISIFLVVFLLNTWLNTGTRQPIARAWSVPAGLVSGLCSAMFGMGGPPNLVYLHMRRLPFPIFRATFVLVGLFSLTWRIAGFAWSGLYGQPGVLTGAALLLPAAVLGMVIAHRARPWIDARWLGRLTYLMLATAAATLAWRGLKTLAYI